MLTLSRLLAAAGLPGPPAGGDPEVTGVVHDSRRAGPGTLFVAIPGEHVDGHDFAAGAVAQGAVAVVAERPVATRPGVPVVLVPDSRAALAPLAARLAGDPSRRLVVVGVTGTDGKTTTTTMLHAAWRGAGLAAAALTTVDFRSRDRVEPNRTRQTTLEAPDLQARLLGALGDGCTHVALETSSHALVLHRVDEVDYRVAVVLRVTSEHLDVHGTRAAYLAAKRRLVEMVGTRADGVAVLDGDDPWGFPAMATVPVARRLVVSGSGQVAGADLRATAVEASPGGVRFLARTPWGDAPVALRLAGRFNAGNALAALAAACVTGASLEGAVAGLEALERVGGRMERVDLGQPFAVVVDYAHTAAALERVLTELRAATPGRLWVVFGSAGERDRPKRPEMGAVAARLADVAVLTDEDPRGEDRMAIIAEIAAGAGAGSGGDGSVLVIPDRGAAVVAALSGARPGDTVLLAGKGHESSIIGPDGARPWDERAAAEAALGELGYRG